MSKTRTEIKGWGQKDPRVKSPKSKKILEQKGPKAIRTDKHYYEPPAAM